jgi:hypothetical protein
LKCFLKELYGQICIRDNRSDCNAENGLEGEFRSMESESPAWLLLGKSIHVRSNGGLNWVLTVGIDRRVWILKYVRGRIERFRI